MTTPTVNRSRTGHLKVGEMPSLSALPERLAVGG